VKFQQNIQLIDVIFNSGKKWHKRTTALDKIGFDVNAFSVWHDYITFLNSVEAIGRTAELQKITAI
jgi:hypothetical protein